MIKSKELKKWEKGVEIALNDEAYMSWILSVSNSKYAKSRFDEMVIKADRTRGLELLKKLDNP